MNTHKANSINGSRLLQAVEKEDIPRISEILSTLSCSDTQEKTILNSSLISAINQGKIEIVELLLKNGAELKSNLAMRCYPLHTALIHGSLDLVKLLIEYGADVNAKDKHGDSPLIVAISKRCSTSLVKYFISSGAKVNIQNKSGMTAAMACIANGDFDNLKNLFDSSADFCLRDKNGKTVFDISADKNLQQFVKLLYENKFNGNKILIEAITQNSVPVVKLLLSCDFINATRKDSPYLLHAVETCIKSKGNGVITKLLIAKGAHVDGDDTYASEGEFPLALAAETGRADLVELLISSGANIEKTGLIPHSTALMRASQAGHLEVIQLLIKAGANVHSQMEEDGSTALSFALENGHVDCARYLLDHGAVVYEEMDILTAVRKDRHKSLELLLEVSDVGKLEENLLCKAVEFNAPKCVESLLKKGYDPNSEDAQGLSPLMRARNLHVMQLLLENGASVNKQNKNGQTALMKEVEKYEGLSPDRVQMLLTHGADTNLADVGGTTPLMASASLEVSKLLVHAGADVNKVNDFGQTALIPAMIHTPYIEAIKLLLPSEDCINVRDKNGSTPLMHAARLGLASPIISLLLEKGADLNIEDYDGNTVLHFIRNAQSVDVLITNGADINKRNFNGRTPLIDSAIWCAAWNSQVNFGDTSLYETAIQQSQVLKSLIDHGADVCAQSKVKESALSVILEDNHMALGTEDCICLEILIKAGAVRDSPFHCNTVLAMMIIRNKPKLLEMCLKGGAAPSAMCLECLITQKCISEKTETRLRAKGLNYVTPLGISVLCGSLHIAQYFVDNWFLTLLDTPGEHKQVEGLHTSDLCRKEVSGIDFSQFLSQPFSLVQIAFIAVSDAVGHDLGREERLKKSGLPSVLMKKLMFTEPSQPLGPESSKPPDFYSILWKTPEETDDGQYSDFEDYYDDYHDDEPYSDLDDHDDYDDAEPDPWEFQYHDGPYPGANDEEYDVQNQPVFDSNDIQADNAGELFGVDEGADYDNYFDYDYDYEGFDADGEYGIND